jgi:hypothetical protein
MYRDLKDGESTEAAKSEREYGGISKVRRNGVGRALS